MQAGARELLEGIGHYASAADQVRLAGERVVALLEPVAIAVYAREGGAAFALFCVRGRAAPDWFADSLLVRAGRLIEDSILS